MNEFFDAVGGYFRRAHNTIPAANRGNAPRRTDFFIRCGGELISRAVENLRRRNIFQ